MPRVWPQQNGPSDRFEVQKAMCIPARRRDRIQDPDPRISTRGGALTTTIRRRMVTAPAGGGGRTCAGVLDHYRSALAEAARNPHGDALRMSGRRAVMSDGVR